MPGNYALYARRGLQLLLICICIIQGVPILIMACIAQDVELIDTYNNAATAFWLQLPFLLLISNYMTWQSTNSLLRTLKSMENLQSDAQRAANQAGVTTIYRIRDFIVKNLPQLVPLLIWPIAHLVLGSAPFHFISVSCIFCFISFPICPATLGFD